MIDHREYLIYAQARAAGYTPRQALRVVRMQRILDRASFSVREFSRAIAAFGVAMRPAVKGLAAAGRALQKEAALQRSREAAATREMRAFGRRKGRLK